jgi:formamidopyrimidine-DNA glycosylase
MKSKFNFSKFFIFLISLIFLIIHLKLEGSATSDALNHAAEEQKEIAAKLESEKGDLIVMLMFQLLLMRIQILLNHF